MTSSSSLLLQALEEIIPRNCHSCLCQFRGGRRRQVKCCLIVCNSCYCSYLYALRKERSLQNSEEMNDVTDMDIDSIITDEEHVNRYRDAEIQTDISFPPYVSCSMSISPSPNTENSIEINSTDYLSLPFHRLPKSTRKCCICGVYFSCSSIQIPVCGRVEAFLNEQIFIPSGCYSCEKHIVEDIIKPSAIGQAIKNSPGSCEITIKELMDMLNDLKEELNRLLFKNEELINKPPISFDKFYRFTNSECHTLTGLFYDQFEDLCSHIPTSAIYNTTLRSSRQAIACFLIKLRLGLSHQTIAALFGLPDAKSVTRVLDSARSGLLKYFVPNNLGFHHISREKLIKERTRPLARALLANNQEQAILILDGTYVYMQKSSNNFMQRRSYSLHKKRPLVKMMMIVSSDGYIVSTFGPYFADSKNNDAEIMKNIILNNKGGTHDWLREGDILVIDRGFRDCLSMLESFGYRAHMPKFLNKNQTQFSTEEANDTRITTKIRWVVEAANGRLKQWRFFDKVMPNTLIPVVGDYFSIVCSLLNRYSSLYVYDTCNDDKLAKKISSLVHQTNELKNYVNKIKDGNEKKLKWLHLDASNAVNDFPTLSYDDLMEITLGIYQLKQAKTYAIEHIDPNGAYEVKVATADYAMMQARIQSRHMNSVKYNVWLKYSRKDILGWFCTCKVGARVIGCCAHVSSLIWYLAYARHNPNQLHQRSSSYSTSILDAAEDSYGDTDTNSDSEDDSQVLYLLTSF